MITPFSNRDSQYRFRYSDSMTIPGTCRFTLGNHSFPAAAAIAWNCLPALVRNATSLLMFCRQLKTFLFNDYFTGKYEYCT